MASPVSQTAFYKFNSVLNLIPFYVFQIHFYQPALQPFDLLTYVLATFFGWVSKGYTVRQASYFSHNAAGQPFWKAHSADKNALK